MIDLVVSPQTPPLSRKQFEDSTPPFSIALDGYVNGGPWIDSAGPRANFDHHDGCSRLATRATCEQAHLAIRMGLYGRFAKSGQPHATLYVNDCDGDVCTAVFLLRNPALCTPVLNPLLNRLVSMEGMLDATAGAYPYPADLDGLQQHAWVFEPYDRFRASGALDRARDADTYRSIITDVGARIMKHITGSGERIHVDTRYEVMLVRAEWAMVRQIGPQARTGMFANAIRAFVAVRERGDGRYTYSIGRMSVLIPFELDALYAALNAAEGTTGSDDRWGGGDTIGGSPRVAGSKLSPDDVAAVVDSVVRGGGK